MLTRLSIRSRVLVLVAVVLSLSVAVGFFAKRAGWKATEVAVDQARTMLDEGQRERLRSLVEITSGVFSEELARIEDPQEKIETLRRLNDASWYKSFADETEPTGYFFVFDYNQISISHALNPSIHGTDYSNNTDADGNRMIYEMARLAEKGGGYFTYRWQKPGTDESKTKLSYAAGIPGTDYWIGTGVYIDDLEVRASAVRDELTGTYNEGLAQAAFIVGGIFVLGILPGVLYILKRSIVAPIRTLRDELASIATGDADLTARIPVTGKDEISQAAGHFNTFMGQLGEMITEIRSNTSQLAAESQTISGEVQRVASVLQDQAVHTSSVAAAAEELSASVEAVASTGEEVTRVSRGAGDQASEGSRVVASTVDEITTIHDVVNTTARSISELGERSESISSVLEVINDIADQTNLLALNAAIEAARAGEHGRGFAVVADEVRKLAERTTKATEEVTGSITEIQEGTRQTVAEIESSQERATRGVELAGEAGRALEAIVNSSADVTSRIESIATATAEQSRASNDVTNSVTQIRSSASNATQAADSAAQAVVGLESRVQKLDALVERFRTN